MSAPSRNLEADVVVIGAGLAGLSAAAHLALEGKKVIVLEHHSVPGGYAHEFRRGDYRFEVALHALDGVGPGGWLRPLLARLGVLDRVSFTRLDPLYTTRFPDHEITAYAELGDYRTELCEHFPHERDGIDALLDALRSVRRDMGGYVRERRAGGKPTPAEMMERYPSLATAWTQPWGSYLATFVTDPELQAVLTTLWGYFGLPPSRLSAGLFALAWGSYHLTGGYYPAGGSQALSRAIAASITGNGGEIRYRSTVASMEVDDGVVTAVETTRGLRVEAGAVISNASPAATIRMAGTEHFPDEFVDRMNADQPALSNLVVYLGLDRDIAADGWRHHEFFVSEGYDLEEDYRATASGDFTPAGMVITNYTHSDPGCAPDGHSVVMLMTLAPWDHRDQWGTGGELQGYSRDPEYRRVKDAAGGHLVARAERLIPGLTDSIDVMEIATPLTNHRYGLAPAGSIYGREQTVENMFLRRHSPRTPLPNLFLAGAWIAGGGMSTALGSGETAAALAGRALAAGSPPTGSAAP